jgi:hypothetical protein
MKKILVILVALIGFGFSANAQVKASISGDPTVRISQDGKTVTISVPISVFFGEKNGLNCRATVKLCPKARTVLDALYINCQWSGTIMRNSPTEYATVYFSCSVKDSSVFQRCGAYDFEVSEVTTDYCN